MRTRAALIALVALSPVVVTVTGGAQAAEKEEPGTTIVVDTLRSRGPAVTQLLGANHRYNDNGSGLWNVRTGAPYKVFVEGAARVGLDSLRFPGGTIANTYDWKRAIGDERQCQVDGRGSRTTGFSGIHQKLAFGPDEYMTTIEQLGVDPLIMVSFVRETPAGAADWVEYMNTPAGDSVNPNEGVDWAEVRAANGHPEPYGVQRWEIGNEQHHLDSRHWMSPDATVAAQEYAFGASPTITSEPLGKGCEHPVGGVLSDGTPGQVFEVLYPPVDPATVQVVGGNGGQWRQVPDISVTRPRARVYEVRADSGEIVFGDGVNGKIPKAGKPFLATYTSVHEGYFAFAEAMKAVDPTIDVCASFGRVSFIHAAEGLPFDCMTTHLITALSAMPGEPVQWADAQEGHDRMMVAALQRRRGAIKLLRALPDETPLWITEAAVIDGDGTAYPSWATSASQAAYMASKWGDWLELGLGFGMSSIFLGGDRAIISPRPHAVHTAEAVTREAITPMFSAGGVQLPAQVQGNPVRQPEGLERDYEGLAVTATRAPDGTVHLMVVNRMPTEAVTATLLVEGHLGGAAEVRTVAGDSFASSNKPGQEPEVTMTVAETSISPEGVTHTFPAASTTVLTLPPAP